MNKRWPSGQKNRKAQSNCGNLTPILRYFSLHYCITRRHLTWNIFREAEIKLQYKKMLSLWQVRSITVKKEKSPSLLLDERWHFEMRTWKYILHQLCDPFIWWFHPALTCGIIKSSVGTGSASLNRFYHSSITKIALYLAFDLLHHLLILCWLCGFTE
jgi:hypothetical protein